MHKKTVKLQIDEKMTQKFSTAGLELYGFRVSSKVLKHKIFIKLVEKSFQALFK